jgi:hypothetical protein
MKIDQRQERQFQESFSFLEETHKVEVETKRAGEEDAAAKSGKRLMKVT